jgi:hypothetical protein
MAKPVLNERTIADYMKRNKCNREEAIDLIKYDIAVEDGEDTEYDLTAEQEANVREMTRKVEHAKQDGKVKRERKPNELKEAIVAEIAEFLREDAQGQMYEDVEITNKSRMIAFTVGEKHFELTLIEKRPPKSK